MNNDTTTNIAQRAKDASPVEFTGTPVPDVDVLSILNSRYKRVDEVMSANKTSATQDAPVVKTTYITLNSSKQSFNLDTSALLPSPKSLLSLGTSFVNNYTQELEDSLNDDSTPANSARFLEICKLYNHIKTTGKPINITSAKLVRKLPSIAQALNKFFNDNAKVIDSITTMVYNKNEKEVSNAAHQ